MIYTEITPVAGVMDVEDLLRSCGLPVADIETTSLSEFYGIGYESELIAVVGLQCMGATALLRSLAVSNNHHGKGIGSSLVSFAESRALAKGVGQVYLLTTDAEEYFYKLGYGTVSRDMAPDVIVSTDQFSTICPSSAMLMVKNLLDPVLEK